MQNESAANASDYVLKSRLRVARRITPDYTKTITLVGERDKVLSPLTKHHSRLGIKKPDR